MHCILSYPLWLKLFSQLPPTCLVVYLYMTSHTFSACWWSFMCQQLSYTVNYARILFECCYRCFSVHAFCVTHLPHHFLPFLYFQRSVDNSFILQSIKLARALFICSGSCSAFFNGQSVLLSCFGG